MSDIHPTAIIDPAAKIGAGVKIGPYCVVGPDVSIGDGSVLKGHVYVEGFTSIGKNCNLFPFASIGTQTQDLKFNGGRPGVKIGDGTTLREYVTVNQATYDGDFTVVGEHCHIMACAHIAHDCVLGNEIIMANAAGLAGHVTVEDQAIIGGLTGVHQFVRVGRLSITGGCSKIVQDIPPFTMTDGNPAAVRGLNRIGLKRHNVSESTLSELKKVYRAIFRKKLSIRQALDEIDQLDVKSPEARHLADFIRNSERGLARS